MTPFLHSLFRPNLALLVGFSLYGVTIGKACPNSIHPKRPQLAVAAAGVGPKWDRYVEYIHRMAERIQNDCLQEPTGPAGLKIGADEVMGWVLLNRRGEMTEIVELDGPQALVDPVRRALAAGMAEHHTYGIWPEEMAKDLGDERQVAMGFYFPGSAGSANLTASSESGPSPAP